MHPLEVIKHMNRQRAPQKCPQCGCPRQPLPLHPELKCAHTESKVEKEKKD